ncbi:MAG: response regulator [Verrucomicrobia bacterium]|nr:response regulator [Verrucomicrobiota bacterium]
MDDEAMIVTLVAAILEDEGYRLELFRDPERALGAFRDAAVRPDLMVTDFAMGALNGLELIRRCRELEPALKTVLISGSIDEHDVRSNPVQPDRFLPKPFQSRALTETVRGLLKPAPQP